MSPRTVLGPVLGPYARLFRAVPGAAWFSLAGWVARLPLPMLGLGAVLLVEGYSGSYALAGAVSGTLALSAAVAGPLWSRAMDRRGQGAVLRRAMAAYLVTGLSLVAVVVGDAPTWTWFLLAALTGASLPNIGAMVRSRWAAALADAERRQTAFAFEAVVDEVVFVVGPPLVTVLGTLVAPAAGFTTGIVLGTAGGLWLARQRGTEPAVAPVPAGPAPRRTAALTPAVLVVCAGYLGVGTVFGAMDVVVVGFAESVGAPALAGVALALYAGGSLLAGLAYGVARLRGSLATRFVVTAVAFGLAAQALWAVSSLPLLVGAGFLAGLAVAPVLVSGASLAESRVPRSALTEALAWTNTGLTLGVTTGSALAGAAVDAWGAQRAFAVPALAAAAAALIALAGAPLLRTRPAAPAEGPVSRVGDAVGG
ncbi:Predicted arabinose efflux permease, MFS family [Geodermatophilus dictyosporus]|uniref:Predicted arabinose efflux permease, MFS family n=1 Tax=Geodermatophilus dictyosporus TaxID=1523247 RepID=A0A1I5UJR9_9ACTN|nr:MFS transporter [Geodermatophilus dictyosporus]SFP95551.1 Predicted arabinose efflux permease, MFS family [Geodermatophilus dictyosporus]